MKRRIKYGFIREQAAKILNNINELYKLRDKLKKDADSIYNGYFGKDAKLIVEKYNEKIKIIDAYLVFISKFQEYFEWLSGNYKDTHEKSVRDITAFTTDLTEIVTPLDIAENIDTENELWII